MTSPLLRFSAANLALGYVVASLAVLTLFATPLWFSWRSSIAERRVEVLREDAQRLTDVFETQGPQGVAGTLERRVARGHTGDNVFVFADPEGRRLAGNLRAWPEGVPGDPGNYALRLPIDGASRELFVVYAVMPGGYRLLLGGDNTPYEHMEWLFWGGIAASGFATIVLGAFAAWAIRREILRRVQRVNQTARAIVAGDLSQRLPTEGGDELDLLVQTVNRMLEQIERLVGGVRNVSDAIAHDLRTPLTELRSRLEEISMSHLSGDETAEAQLEAAVADVDRVIAIFNALLRLAEIDSGLRRSGFARTDLGLVARDTIEFYQPLAEDRGMRLEADLARDFTVSGDRVLLGQAIANLVDNAIKYAPAGSTITVEGTRRDDRVEITVADRGPGIAAGEHAKVVERFYRGDGSRGATPGVGLGLPLVAAAARLHGGLLRFGDNAPGLRATLELPAAPAEH